MHRQLMTGGTVDVTAAGFVAVAVSDGERSVTTYRDVEVSMDSTRGIVHVFKEERHVATAPQALTLIEWQASAPATSSAGFRTA